MIWLPTRVHTKKLFPNCLDVSVGGHVKAGESYEQALYRETKEEVSISLRPNDFKLVAKASPYTYDISAFMHIYCIHYHGTGNPNFNEDDFSHGSWYEIEDAILKIKRGVASKSDLPVILKIFKDKKNEAIYSPN